MSTSPPVEEVKRPLFKYELVMRVWVELPSYAAAESFGNHLCALVKDGGGASDAETTGVRRATR